MGSEFDRRLAEVGAKLKRSREQADAENAQERAEWDRRIAKIQAAISDWNPRIAPAIMNAVTKANQEIGTYGLQLATKPEPSHTITVHLRPEMRNRPPLPPRPALVIFGRIGQSMPRLKIEIDTNGMIAITASQGMNARGPMEASAFTEEQIGDVIASFVEALIP
jgi:hypothetical protein